MIRKRTLMALALVSLMSVILASAPALAITGGGPDTIHANVGLVRIHDGGRQVPLFRHLDRPDGRADRGSLHRRTGDQCVRLIRRRTRAGPAGGRRQAGGEAARGTIHRRHPPSRPGLRTGAGFAKQHDQGVVASSTSATTKWPTSSRLHFRRIGFMDRDEGRLKNGTFTLVGYGVDIGERKARIVIQVRS